MGKSERRVKREGTDSVWKKYGGILPNLEGNK